MHPAEHDEFDGNEADLNGLLCSEQKRLALQVAELTDEHDSIIASMSANLADDEHDAEGSTLAYERARVSALLEHARLRLAQFNEALEHSGEIRQRDCEDCGQPILIARLGAIPTTRVCTSCASRSGPSRFG